MALKPPYSLGVDSRRFKTRNSSIVYLQRSLVFSCSTIGASRNREHSSTCVLGLIALDSSGVTYTRLNMTRKGHGKQGSPVQLLFGCSTLVQLSATGRTVHFSTFSAAPDKTFTGTGSFYTENNELSVMILDSPAQDFSQVTRLIRALHGSASSFLSAVEQHRSLTKGPWFAKAWIGVDMNAWMKYFSYQAAVCALLQAVLEIGAHGNNKRSHAYLAVQKILLPQISFLDKSIRRQLSSKDPDADKWFWSEQFPVAVTRFTNIMNCDSQFKDFTSRNWEQGELSPSKSSDIALIMLATSSCTAVRKLGPGKIPCPELLASLPEKTEHLMCLLADIVSIEQMCLFTSQVGLKEEFLKFFGSKISGESETNCSFSRERTFCVDLIQMMLKAAIQREGVILKLAGAENTKVEVLKGDLAVFGFFAILGRKTRYFLSSKNVTDLDEPLKIFLSYLEGGIVLFYPQLLPITLYQLFIEVASDELEWLHFYPTLHDKMHQNKSSFKQSIGKVEKEMILAAAFGVCSDWIRSFIYYSKWIQQPAAIRAAKFVLDSQNQLNVCLEEYQMATSSDTSGLVKCRELKITDEIDREGNQDESRARTTSMINDAGQRYGELDTGVLSESTLQDKVDLVVLEDSISDADIESVQRDIFSKSIEKIKAVSSDVWMGTQLLATDVAVAVDLLQKSIAGHRLTSRESKKLKQTLTDLASVIPIGILMLLPVTAVGHAAMLAAIQKYVPALIPSAYSSSRLDLLKQLKQVKQMEVRSTRTAGHLTCNKTIGEANGN